MPFDDKTFFKNGARSQEPADSGKDKQTVIAV
jgi:hypothetical protein